MNHIPGHIKKRITHPNPESQISGFEQLFVHLNSHPGPRNLRRLVVAYFNENLPLRPHLRCPNASSSSHNQANQGDPSHTQATASEPGRSIQIVNSILGSFNVQAAAFDSYENAQRASCFEGTRTKLLEYIESWINADSGKQSIFVLYGVAGIGKSTTAKTIAERAASINVLGASFFFSRNEETRKTAKSFFPTLAYHLARYDKDFARRISDALEKDPDAAARDLRKQFQLLIAEPLRMSASRRRPTLIVIDALDECEDHAEIILSLLVRDIHTIPGLKVLLTARPERHIRNALCRYSNHEQFCIHEIEESVVEGDIRLYLNSRLSEEAVQNALPELQPPPWQPTEEEKKILVGMSGKLFIIASTAVAFILDNRRLAPPKQLAALINGVSRRDFSGCEHTTVLDQVYLQILRGARPDLAGDWIDEYQTFVGTIILLHEPLPSEALARLLGVEMNEIIAVLSNLHSLLAPSGKDQTFRVHHKSFPDFLTNPERCQTGPEFCINPKSRHMQIARCCLCIMDRSLKFNMCGLERGDMFKDLHELLNRTQGHIANHLSYACTYWAPHLVSGLGSDGEFDEEVKLLLERFANKHLLAWLEVLSLIGRMDTAYANLNTVYTVIERARNRMISDTAEEIFYDGCRFILRNISEIKLSPMYVYYSALPFMPTSTLLFRTYKNRFPGVFRVISGTDNNWTPLIAVLRGHSGGVRSITFSADGSRLVSASDDHTVQLWDAQTSAHLATLGGHSTSVLSVIFSADNCRLASISIDGAVRVWDGKTGAHLSTLESRPNGQPYRGSCRIPPCMAFSADGLRLASGFGGHSVRLWDGEAGVLITILKGHSRPVNSVAFSVDGSRIASASEDGTARLWDGKTGAPIATLAGHSSSVHSVLFSPDGSTLASASTNDTVRLWGSETGTRIAKLRSRPPGKRPDSRSVIIAFSADGSRLASAFGRVSINLWDSNTFELIATLDGHSRQVCSLAFSPDGSRLASASYDATARLWDGTTGAHITTLVGHSSSINRVVFSPGGLRLATASNDCTMQLWDSKASSHAVTVQHGTEPITSVMFSTDGSRLSSSSRDHTVRLWDGKTGAQLATLEGHSKPVTSAIFSIDGSRLASTSDDGTVRLWDGNTGAHVATLGGHLRHSNLMVFSLGGSRLASRSQNYGILLWDGKTGARIATLKCDNHTTCNIFSADGSRLASGAADGTVQLWAAETGACIAIIKTQPTFIRCLIFSSDGLTLATSSANGTVQLWDINTRAHIATLQGHTSPVTDLIFSANGSRLASFCRGAFSLDKTVRVWDCATNTILHLFHCQITHHSSPLRHPNLTFLVGRGLNSALCGLLTLEFQVNGNVDLSPLCWFPPDMRISAFTVDSTASIIAIGCADGRIILIDISNVPFP